MEIWLKQKTSPRMHYVWIGKTIKKKFRSKKSKVKSPHVNKKTTSEKANFCSNTVPIQQRSQNDLRKKDSAPIQFKFFEL